jgi:integrase
VRWRSGGICSPHCSHARSGSGSPPGITSARSARSAHEAARRSHAARHVSTMPERMSRHSSRSHCTAFTAAAGYPLAYAPSIPARPQCEPQRPCRHRRSARPVEALTARDDLRHPAETGCRLAEVLGLAWENVHLDEQTIEFTHQLDRKGKRVPLKTKRSRRILEVTPGLIGKLREHKIAAARTAPHDLVFTTRTGSGHDHRNIGGRVLARAVKRADLEAVEDHHGAIVQPAPTFHDLRHSHASALIAAGWDIEEVSSRLGHSDVGTTQRTYVHAFDAARRSDDRRTRLAKLYGGGSVEASMEATDGRTSQDTQDPAEAKVVDLQARRDIAQ